MQQFDVVVIGGGPGGYVAAIRAAQLKLTVALIESQHLGGICLNWGCIPTKALLRSAEMLHYAKEMSNYGIEVKDIKFDLAKMVERSRKISGQLSSGVKGLLKKNKVTVFDGTASLKPGKIVSFAQGSQKTEIKASNIIIATGARAKVLPGYEPDGELVWTYKEAMTPKAMPKSLIIVGSGAIGIEFASFYNTLGAKVTVVESQERILPVEDREISDFAKAEFVKQGIEFITSAKLGVLKKHKDHVELEITTSSSTTAPKNTTLKADHIIMAVGITGNIENIGLENTKVKTSNGHIVTNPYLLTDESGVYAIGDVAGAPWLAHKASHEGIIAAEAIAGLKPHSMVRVNIPGCTYSMPQIASLGLTEDAAIAAGHKIKIGRFPYIGNGKAIALGEPSGLVKTIFDEKTGELLGAHMIGAEVTELIQGFVIGKTMEATELDFMHTIFPHPTLSEMMHESVLSAYGRAIHM
ncbi:MAG: dihydrolipoyl dehydrogenase [Pseudomonadota bacterium]